MHLAGQENPRWWQRDPFPGHLLRLMLPLTSGQFWGVRPRLAGFILGLLGLAGAKHWPRERAAATPRGRGVAVLACAAPQALHENPPSSSVSIWQHKPAKNKGCGDIKFGLVVLQLRLQTYALNDTHLLCSF